MALVLRELHAVADLKAVHALFGAIWKTVPGDDPLSVEVLRALAHAGNYVAGAFADGVLVGASVGFLAAPAGTVLHSHITGTAPGRGVGRALKLHQRRWALDRGLARITWTFDPLVRRNAHFNIARLGALPVEYLPSFYGEMTDRINAGDTSDRVLAVWTLEHPRVDAAVRGLPWPSGAARDAVTVLESVGGLPRDRPAGRARTVLVAVPPDVEGLRAADPAAARAWRSAVRGTLGGLLAEGGRVTGFHDRSAYVVERSRYG